MTASSIELNATIDALILVFLAIAESKPAVAMMPFASHCCCTTFPVQAPILALLPLVGPLGVVTFVLFIVAFLLVVALDSSVVVSIFGCWYLVPIIAMHAEFNDSAPIITVTVGAALS